jgi:hypothetical protein
MSKTMLLRAHDPLLHTSMGSQQKPSALLCVAAPPSQGVLLAGMLTMDL